MISSEGSAGGAKVGVFEGVRLGMRVAVEVKVAVNVGEAVRVVVGLAVGVEVPASTSSDVSLGTIVVPLSSSPPPKASVGEAVETGANPAGSLVEVSSVRSGSGPRMPLNALETMRSSARILRMPAPITMRRTRLLRATSPLVDGVAC